MDLVAPFPTVIVLLNRSWSTLEAACHTSDASERFRGSHLGALRAAAALIAARTVRTGRSRPRSVWQVLPTVAPDLTEWAGFFAAASARRSALDRGERATAREADDLLRQAEMFLEIVQDALGVPLTTALPERTMPLVSALTGTGDSPRATHERHAIAPTVDTVPVR